MTTLAFCALLAALANDASSPPDQASARIVEKATLSGAWEFTSCVSFDGKPTDQFNGGRYVFEKDRCKVINVKGKLATTFIFRCDPTTTPKQFDFIRPRQTNPAGRGVYDIRNGTLYLYIAWGGARPKTLARSPGGVAFTARQVE